MSPTPAADLRARVLAAARREPVRTRAQGIRARGLVLALGFAAPLVVSAVLGGPNLHGRPAGYEWSMALCFAALAGAATWAGVGQGRSMLGRPTAWRLAVATLTPVALLTVTLVASALWPETAQSHDTVADMRSCLIFTPLFALGPLVAFTVVRRGSDPIAPGLGGAAMGTAAGAWGAVGITLHCPHTSITHVALAHLGPVVLVALVGALAGQRIVAIRAKTG